MRKVEHQGLPAGVGVNGTYTIDCHEDFQTIISLRNNTGVAESMTLEGGPGPSSFHSIAVPALTTILYVFSASAYTPASAAGVVPAVVQYPAFAFIRMTPFGAGWGSFSIAVTHVIL